MAPPLQFPDVSDQSSSSGPSVVVIVCAVAGAVGAVVFVLVLAAIAIPFARRRHRRQDARDQPSTVDMFPKGTNPSRQSTYFQQDSSELGMMPLLNNHPWLPPDYEMKYGHHPTFSTHSSQGVTYHSLSESTELHAMLRYPPLMQESTRPRLSVVPSLHQDCWRESNPIPPVLLEKPLSHQSQRTSDETRSSSISRSAPASHPNRIQQPSISKRRNISLPPLSIPEFPSPLPIEKHIPLGSVTPPAGFSDAVPASTKSDSSVPLYFHPTSKTPASPPVLPVLPSLPPLPKYLQIWHPDEPKPLERADTCVIGGLLNLRAKRASKGQPPRSARVVSRIERHNDIMVIPSTEDRYGGALHRLESPSGSVLAHA